MKLTSRAQVVTKTPSDFIAEYIGHTEARTKRILTATVGKVLVIDNAEVFDDGVVTDRSRSFKNCAIDTLVSIVQGVPGEDRCIILVGFEKKIRTMFDNVHPGLARRFPLDQPFRFRNFDTPQLLQILKFKMREKGLGYEEEAMAAARVVLERARVRRDFSNITAVDQILEIAQIRLANRLSKMPPRARKYASNLEALDFDPNAGQELRLTIDSRKALAGRLNGDLISLLVSYQDRCAGAWKRGMDPVECLPMNFVFKGLPGTGRSTAARSIAQMYHKMGILKSPDVVECYGHELIAATSIDTPLKMMQRFTASTGRVLFVRDADFLCSFTTAVHEICRFLGQPQNQGKMVIILSGLQADMTWLMTTWPILFSFFDEEVVFENISPEDCITLLVRELEERKMKAATEAPFLTDPASDGYAIVRRLFFAMQQLPGWSNAREVRQLAKHVVGALLERLGRPDPSDASHGEHDTSQQTNMALDLITSCMTQRIKQRRDIYVAPAASNENPGDPMALALLVSTQPQPGIGVVSEQGRPIGDVVVLDEYSARDRDVDFDHDAPDRSGTQHEGNLPAVLLRRATDAKMDGPGPQTTGGVTSPRPPRIRRQDSRPVGNVGFRGQDQRSGNRLAAAWQRIHG